MTSGDLQTQTEEWYHSYYAERGRDRNSLLRNRGVVLQKMASELSLLAAISPLLQNNIDSKILDVGCGRGGDLPNLLRWGIPPGQLYGVEIREEKVKEANCLFPSLQITQADAQSLPFKDDSFDIVMEGTLLVQVTDWEAANRIAQEMIRVCKPGGHLLLSDWRYSRPFEKHFCGLTRRRTERLFGAGTQTRLLSVHPGALIPPVGRILSSYLRPLYFPVQLLCPFLVGQVTWVLQKLNAQRVPEIQP